MLTGRPARHAASPPGLPEPGRSPELGRSPEPGRRPPEPGRRPPEPGRRPPEPGRSPERRARYLVGALVAVLALVAGVLYLDGRPAAPPSRPAAAATRAGVPVASAAPGACGSGPAGSCAEGPVNVGTAHVQPTPAAHRPGRTGRAGRSAARSAPPSASPTPTASSTAAVPTASVSAAPVSQQGTPAEQVLALINQARSAVGLPPLTVTDGLVSSSSAHNIQMADGCGLSHQCPGEQAIGERETEAGVAWTDCGENIGEGGPAADTTAAIAQMAVLLTQDMLNEVPPDDGHRLNILSATFTHIGIAVYRDSSGTVWLTQDFSG